jgi:hypothetical protein
MSEILSGDEFQELCLRDAILATDRYETLAAEVSRLREADEYEQVGWQPKPGAKRVDRGGQFGAFIPREELEPVYVKRPAAPVPQEDPQ